MEEGQGRRRDQAIACSPREGAGSLPACRRWHRKARGWRQSGGGQGGGGLCRWQDSAGLSPALGAPEAQEQGGCPLPRGREFRNYKQAEQDTCTSGPGPQPSCKPPGRPLRDWCACPLPHSTSCPRRLPATVSGPDRQPPRRTLPLSTPAPGDPSNGCTSRPGAHLWRDPDSWAQALPGQQLSSGQTLGAPALPGPRSCTGPRTPCEPLAGAQTLEHGVLGGPRSHSNAERAMVKTF